MKPRQPLGTKENVTMKTIAEEAGVTLTTVSRILNNKGGKYADSTKQKIFGIADRLKYRPNALVRGMQTGKTGTAGVMIPASSFFYSQVVDGIHDLFVDNDIIMLLSWNNRSLNEREEVLERQIIHQMIDRRVEGIILRPSSEDFERSYFEEIWERDIPLILIDREMSNVDTDFVGTDDYAGGKAAAEHLISMGHRSMIFAGDHQASTSRNREKGFRQVLSETMNASCKANLVTNLPTSQEQFNQIINGPDAPTAAFCYNDDVARRVTALAEDAGLSIPKDLSLIGFGNIPHTDRPIALTTFDQRPHLIGKTAAQLYLDRVNKDTSNSIRREIIQPVLIEASSVTRL